TALEQEAMDQLRTARVGGSLAAMQQTEAILERSDHHKVAGDLRARVFELAEALFQSIRMQLSVPRYQAISVDRGANLDTIDMPLNNRHWLKDRFAALRELEDEAERLRGLEGIVNW